MCVGIGEGVGVAGGRGCRYVCGCGRLFGRGRVLFGGARSVSSWSSDGKGGVDMTATASLTIVKSS